MALIAGLWVSNPTEPQFKAFAEAQIEARIQDEMSKRSFGGSELGAYLKGMASEFLSKFAERNVVRKNYYVFSIFILDVPEDVDKKDWRFLGIAGQFIPLERPEILENRNQ